MSFNSSPREFLAGFLSALIGNRLSKLLPEKLHMTSNRFMAAARTVLSPGRGGTICVREPSVHTSRITNHGCGSSGGICP